MGLLRPVEVSFGNTDRSGMGLSLGPSGPVTSPVSEDPPSKHDECVLDRAEITVPARCRIEHVAEGCCQGLNITVRNFELEERPDPRLTRNFVPNSKAIHLVDGEPHAFEGGSNAHTLTDEDSLCHSASQRLVPRIVLTLS